MAGERGYKLGSVLWIEHTDDGDVTHRVRVAYERHPGERELCMGCKKGNLTILGHVIQYGILDDEIYAIAYCDHCTDYTCYKYHVEAVNRIPPEQRSGNVDS